MHHAALLTAPAGASGRATGGEGFDSIGTAPDDPGLRHASGSILDGAHRCPFVHSIGTAAHDHGLRVREHPARRTHSGAITVVQWAPTRSRVRVSMREYARMGSRACECMWLYSFTCGVVRQRGSPPCVCMRPAPSPTNTLGCDHTCSEGVDARARPRARMPSRAC